MKYGFWKTGFTRFLEPDYSQNRFQCPKRAVFCFENTKTAHFGPKADIQKFGFLSTHYSSHPGAPALWGYSQTVDKDRVKRGQSVTKEWIYPRFRHSLSSSRLSFHFDLTLSTVYPVVYPMIIPSQSLSEFYPQIIMIIPMLLPEL